MEIRFDGKRVLVTGAGRGIGRGIAEKLAECGANVIAIDKNQASLDTLKEKNTEIYCQDITDWEATRSLVQKLGPIHLLVNNAATGVLTPFLDVKKEELGSQFETNYNAVFNISQVVGKDMVKRGNGGAIVIMSSMASLKAMENHVVYSSTKAALDQLTRCLALELGPHKIRVNAVSPTVTLTQLAIEAGGWGDPKKASTIINRTPLRRLGEVEDMVNATLFLLSDKADMISGLIMPVDGGITKAM